MMSEAPGIKVRGVRWMDAVRRGDIEGWGTQHQAYKKAQHAYDIPFWGKKFSQG